MAENTIQIKAMANGPLQIKGKHKLKDSNGKEIINNDNIYLCRCGHSKNKPFCDGSHKVEGFTE